MLGIKYHYNAVSINDKDFDALTGEKITDKSKACFVFLTETPSGFHAPELRHSEEGRVGMHGILDHDTLVGKRAITLTGQLVAPNREKMVALVDRFQKAFTTSAVPSQDDGYHELKFTEEDGIAKKLFAKVETMPEYVEEMNFPFVRNFFVSLKCKEPRKLSEETRISDEIKTDLLGSQIKLPILLPFQTGYDYIYKKTLTNAGNFASSPRIVIHGACKNPKIKNCTYGAEMQFECELLAGDRLEVDVLAGTAEVVREDGTHEDALLYLTNESDFFYLLSGENTVAFLEESGIHPVHSKAYAKFYFSDTWL